MDAKTLFEILIRENTDMLVAFLRAGVRDRHAVEDLYQETVLTAWRRINDYDTDKPFGPWLRGIAGRNMLAYFRKNSRTAKPLNEEILDWLNDRFGAIQAREGDTFHEKLALLRDCVQALPETYQETINLRYSDQRSLDEMVELLSSAKETIKKRLHRAKQRLSDCLNRKLDVARSS